jgi:hypothetical protein
MELAIVVARRSWLEISLWKNWERQEGKKEHTREEEEEKDPNNRAQPPRSGDCDSAWTSFLQKGKQRSIIR